MKVLRSFSKLGMRVMLILGLALLIPWAGNGGWIINGAYAAGTNYYVSPSGSDTNPGTINAPWRTIQKAAKTAGPGSIVNVRGGTYKEKVVFAKSGSAVAGPIVFQSYPGETAIVDGTGLSVTDASSALFTLEDKSYITIRGFELRNLKTAVQYRTPMGIYVSGAGDHIEIRNNNIHHIETNVQAADGGDAHGIAFYGTAAPASLNNIVIDGNHLSNLKLGSSEALVVNGNVETFQITNNIVHDNNNIGICVIGWEGTSPDPAYDQARNGVVSGNTVYNTTSYGNPAYGTDTSADGIYVDGGKDTVIERNVSHHNDVGIEFTSEHKSKSASNITVRSNLVHDNIMGISLGGYDTSRGYTENSKIVNNTLYNNDKKNQGFGQIFIQYDTRNNIIQNNIIYAGTSPVLIGNDYKANTGNVVDYNLYYTAAGGANSVWTWKNATYTGFDKYKSATGNDAHSLFADPLFADPAAPDLHLQPGSPAINAGQNEAYLGAADYDGNARVQGATVDLGAYEAAEASGTP
ncbi:right-handed parallel beta-helix repeat-containing protein [Paenibacillus sp. P25]|nr:right-handed parallel beta-helix repeat-containing protein [Paenibacillus sp. P25]